MSKVDEFRERYGQKNGPAYNYVSSIQKDQNDLLLEILCEFVKLNEREEAKTAAASQVKDAPLPTRAKLATTA